MFNTFKFPAQAPSRYGLVYLILAAALPILPLFNNRAIVPLAIAGALALFVMAAKDGKLGLIVRIDRLLWLGIGGYLMIALISSVLGDTWAAGFIPLVKLLGLSLIAIILIPLQARLTASDIRWIACALIAAVAFTLLWIGIYILNDTMKHAGADATVLDEQHREWIGLYGYFWFKPATTVAVISSLIAGIFLHRNGHRIPAICLAVCSAGFCYWISSRTALYGMMLALALGIIYHFMGRYRLRITLLALAIAFTLPPAINTFGFSPDRISAHLNRASSGSNSIVYRLHIWEFVVDKITEKPLLGWGAGASKRLGTDEVGTLYDQKFGALGEPIPVHPHNAILQVWLEFGFTGALFIFLLIARGMAITDKHLIEPWQRIWVSASGALIACFFGFSFSIASSWWLVTVITSIAIAAAFAGPKPMMPVTEENTLR